MKRLLSILIAFAIVSPCAADELPQGIRAKLEQMAPIQKPIVSIPAFGKNPARWMVFLGPTSAFSAFLVTPGAGDHEIVPIAEWPAATRVVGATIGPLPKGLPGASQEPLAFLVLESIEARVIGQPGGLRVIMPITLPDAKSTPSKMLFGEELSFFAGVKDEHEVQARLEAVARFWNEDVTGKVLADSDALTALIAKAQTSDDTLRSLIPTTGVSVIQSWQGVYPREIGRVGKLDNSELVKALRHAIQTAGSCSGGTACGGLALGVEQGHPVIRAANLEQREPTPTHTPRAVTKNAGDTQTSVTARALGLVPKKLYGEAPLTETGGTVGVINDGNNDYLIARDGDFAVANVIGLAEKDHDLAFADLDGDGVTEVIHHTMYGSGFERVVGWHESSAIQAYELVSLGKKTPKALAAAALALKPEKVTAADACTLVMGMTSTSAVEKGLADGGQIFTYEEPSNPTEGKRANLTGKTRLTELRSNLRTPCQFTCHDTLPICVDEWQPPGIDYYLFTYIKGKLRLVRAALYRGA